MIFKKSMLLSAMLLSAALCFSAQSVDFYGTVSSSNDSNMIKMTTELFYTQFRTVDGYTVNDRRNLMYDNAEVSPVNISFYAEVQEDLDGGWLCTLNAFKTSANVSSTKKYDSYYKILLDAKSSIENLLANLEGNIRSINFENAQKQSAAEQVQVSDILEDLSGTWTGESHIEKIMILRGGRGFVIFKNGASMNVLVTADGNNVTVTQNGRSNASFFPELAREVAMKNATDAVPVVWNLVYSDNTLTGTKKTLVSDESGVRMGEIPVTWQKK